MHKVHTARVVLKQRAFWRLCHFLALAWRRPLDHKGWGSDYGFYWGHAEQWLPEYRNHSYIRIRDMQSGHVVQNISLSIGFGFGAAFVDYDHGTLWISATANDRVNGGTAPRPYGPPHDHSCGGHWECNGVWVFNSSDLLSWTRRQTDVTWNGPNTDIARVYHSPAHPTPPNLPPHRYVMATETGAAWARHAGQDPSHPPLTHRQLQIPYPLQKVGT